MFINYQTANLAKGRLKAGISASAGSIILDTNQGDLFPSTYPYLLKIEKYDTSSSLEIKPVLKREIVEVSNKSGDTFTVTRSAGYCPESDTATTQTNTAFAFDSGDYVYLVDSTEWHEDVANELIRLENDKANDSEVVHNTGDENVDGVKTFSEFPIVPITAPTADNEVANKKYVDDEVISAQQTDELIDDSFMLGEPVLAGQCVFLETGTTTGLATNKQAIGNNSSNTRASFPVIGTGVAGDTFKVNLCKTGSTHPVGQGLYFRIETDDAGIPSGTLIDPNAIAHILPASLTTSLADTTINFTGGSGTDAHGVTLDSTEATQTVYKGVKITLAQQTAIISVDKDSDCTATKAYLYDTSDNLLATATFIGNVATFSYTGLLNGQSYYILCGSDGASYTSVKQTGSASYPYNKTKFNYIGGGKSQINTVSDIFPLGSGSSSVQGTVHEAYFTVNKVCIVTRVQTYYGQNVGCTLRQGSTILDTSSDGEYFTGGVELQPGVTYTYYWTNNVRDDSTGLTFPYNGTNINITGVLRNTNNSITFTTTDVSIVADSNINNIVDINYGGQITIPEGQKCHLVAFQSTSDDYADTVIDTDYYNIGYSTNNTTTRGLIVYNGSDWTGIHFTTNGLLNAILYTQLAYRNNDGYEIEGGYTDSHIAMPYSSSWALAGAITPTTYAGTNLVISADSRTRGYNGAGSGYCGIALERDANNYVRFTNTVNSNTSLCTLACYVYVGGVQTYTASVGNLAHDTVYRLKIVKVGNDYSFYYRTGSRTQLGVTQTQAFTGSPYIHYSGGSTFNRSNAYIDNPTISDNDYVTYYPINSISLFPYVSSTLFQDKLLSLTDADYAYKIDLVGVSIENKGIGTYPKLTIQGINGDQNGLTVGIDYYLGNTPGNISSIEGTIRCKIGNSITAKKIFLSSKLNTSITPSQYYYAYNDVDVTVFLTGSNNNNGGSDGVDIYVGDTTGFTLNGTTQMVSNTGFAGGYNNYPTSCNYTVPKGKRFYATKHGNGNGTLTAKAFYH